MEKDGMKKILILTAVTILTATAGGCRMCDWLFRGSAVRTAPVQQAPMMYDPCVPCEPCDPCAPCGGGGAPMILTPGPETYVPTR